MKLIKIPYSEESLGKNNGCEKAPDRIINLLNDIWTNENYEDKSLDVDEIINFKDNIKKADIYLGGDHSITYWTFKEFVRDYSNPGIIIFDSHPDVYKEFEYPTHDDWLYYLIEENILNPENIIIIGVRNPDLKEIDYIKNKKIKFFPAKILYNNLETICDTIMEIAMNFDAIYLSIDIDVLDPAFAPATDYLEPGGLSTRELLYFIQRLKLLKKLKVVDLVEINPDKDFNDMTCKLGAKIVKELL